MRVLVLGIASVMLGAAKPDTKGATDAYVFGYPLVTMEMTRRVMTNVETPEAGHAPMNQFASMRKYPDAHFRDVTMPNADTLYQTAWLDLGKEPIILGVPDMKGRYFLLPMLSAYTEVFASPGSRTTGTNAETFVITGPNWHGKLPSDAKEIKSPTNMVWILGRIYSSGTPEDVAEVHALQDSMKLIPLHAYGKSYTPPKGRVDSNIDMKTPVRDQVNRMDAAMFFGTMAKLMKDNPSASANKTMDPNTFAAMNDIPPTAQKLIAEQEDKMGHNVNGWIIPKKLGNYGTDSMNRAVVTMFGLGANKPEDAFYPISKAGSDNQPYDGTHKYVVHLDKSSMPPVNGFWSLTMYGEDYFFVDNSLDRFNLSSRSPFVKNSDGSVDIYIQKDSPGKEKEANWLPAPDGKFVLALRLYWPKPDVASWKPPPVKRAD
jgi:hypothetical protein